MIRSVQTAVICVAAFGQRLSKAVIKNTECLSCLVNWQQEQVGHEHGVHDKASHDGSPNNHMRARHDCVRQMDGSANYHGKASAKVSSSCLEVLLRV